MFGLFKLIKVSKSQPVQEPTQAQKEPIVQKAEHKTNSLNDGWIAENLDNVMLLDDVVTIFNEVSSNTKWLEEIKLDWLKNIKRYRTNDLLKILLSNRDTSEDDEVYIQLKRDITVSSIYYKFPIPMKLFLMDSEALLCLMRYKFVSDIVKIDINKCSNLEISEVVVRDITYYVNQLMSNVIFRQTIDDLPIKGYRGTPNIYNLYLAVLNNVGKEADLKKLTLDQFKKVLTCLLLECNIAIPKNWLHLDIDVYNWVTKQAGYDTVEKPSNVFYLQ